MSYITTFTGRHFDPVCPDESLIDITDIAHSLSLLCRANGHFAHFYSVAQHSLACAKEAEACSLPKEVVLGCLLHDASEAYLSDVTRPVKKDLTYYLEVEKTLQDLLWQHFIGRIPNEEEQKQIFEIDDRMLSMEFHILMPEELNEDYLKLALNISCDYVQPEVVEKEFMEYFGKLK